MIPTRQTSLITLCALLMISLFTPTLPGNAEQWLSLVLIGLLVVVLPLVLGGCRRFMLD